MRMGFAGIIAVAILALEIVGMALMAREIGALRVLAWLLLDVLAGLWLLRSAGAGFMTDLMQAAARGRDPFAALWHVGRRFLAGLLLIFPGFFSDALALLLLLAAGLPQRHVRQAVQRPAGRREEEVIEGEFRRED